MKRAKVLSIFIVFVFLSGCANKIEIEEAGFVLVIGLDKPVDGKGIVITFQLADPLSGSPGSQPAGQQEEKTITLQAPDLITAKYLLNVSETRKINFFHTKAMVVGEEFARSKEFLPLISTLARDPQVRRDMFMIVSKERAEDYLRNNKPAFETSPHKYYDFMSRRWDISSMVPPSTYHQFLTQTEADAGLSLSIYSTGIKKEAKNTLNEDDILSGQLDKKGGTPTQMIGAAVFKEGKMIDTFTGEEVRLISVLTTGKKPQQMRFSFPDPLNEEFRVIGNSRNISTKVHVDVSKPSPSIQVDVWMSVTILSIPSAVNYVEDIRKQELLDEHLQERYKEISNRFIIKTQELGAEPFRWYLEGRKQFLTLDDYQKYDWMKSYPDADVDVNFHIRLDQFGKHLRPRNLEKIRD
ncbi:Ger(x)C family spore germination protein [Rossellomorea aquimaris]|uniref:Ger(x)C family spore germination protein n=1 Tax=Rossellomorea aquimaris TaxID=189382 RepID=UPI0005C87731|nr:Ger(x)C family spore germination protein [Rossellomorea aquimaris]